MLQQLIRTRRYGAAVLLCSGLSACCPPVSFAQVHPVPASPPSLAPRELWTRENQMQDSIFTRGSFLRDIAAIRFKPGASQRERQAAVNLVGGNVVGGIPLGNGDGYYLVRVPGDGTARPLFKALQRLRALPQIDSAAPQYVGILSP
jgi:hypothetical protein